MFLSFLSNTSFFVWIIILVLLAMSIYTCYISIFSYKEIYEKQKEVFDFKRNILTKIDGFKIKKGKFDNFNTINDLIIINYEKFKDKEKLSVKEINSKKIACNEEDFERVFKSLATIASLSPYLGLLGTVIGIINTFGAIVDSGSVSLLHVAPSIGESLVVTAIGLFVAIPATYIYNDLIVRTEKVFSFYKTLNEEIYLANTK